MCKQTGGYTYQVASGKFSFGATCSERKRPENVPFYSYKRLNCISCSMVCKTFFGSNSPDIPDKAGKKQEEVAEEEHRQLQNVMRFTQTQIFIFTVKISDEFEILRDGVKCRTSNSKIK